MQNLVHRDHSKHVQGAHVHAHAHTHARTHSHTLTHTGTRTHQHTDYTKLNLHNLKRAANRDSRQMKTAAWNGKCGRSIIFGGKCFPVAEAWQTAPVQNAQSFRNIWILDKDHFCLILGGVLQNEVPLSMSFHRQASFITNWSMWMRVCLCLSSVLLQSALCSHFVR